MDEKRKSKRRILIIEQNTLTYLPKQQRKTHMHTDYIAPWHQKPPEFSQPQSAIVIGAGISGASTAYSLAQRGWQVTVLERRAQPAAEGSGNAQGILHLQLSPHLTTQSQLLLAGYAYSLSVFHRLLQKNDHWQDCGVLNLDFSEKEAERHAKLIKKFPHHPLFRAVDVAEASAIAGICLTSGGLFFPKSGWINPAFAVRALLSHPRITCRYDTGIARISQTHPLWELYDNQENIVATAPVVVVATAFGASTFEQMSHLPLHPVRGQTSILSATEKSQQLKTVLSGQGYISPAWQNAHCFGATSVHHDQNTQLLDEEHQQNVAQLPALSPELAHSLSVQTTFGGHAAIRCFSPDRLPLVGPIACRSQFIAQYARLSVDRNLHFDSPCPWQQGLYVNIAHGARGLLTAPISGELIADYVTPSQKTLAQSLIEAINPNRFLVRELAKMGNSSTS